MQQRTRATVVLVALTAVAAGALGVVGAVALARAEPLLAAALLAAVAILSFRPIRIFSHAELSLGDIAVLAAAVLLPPLAAVPVAVLGALPNQLASRRPAVQQVRDVSAGAVTAGAASLAYAAAAALLPGQGLAEGIPAALVAALAFVGTDVAQLAALVATLPGIPAAGRRAVWLWRVARRQLLWSLAAVVAIEIVRVEPLFAVAVVPLIYFGFQDDRARHVALRRATVLETLIDVSHAVGSTLDTTEVFRAVYAKVRDTLEADAFFVALPRGDDVMSYRYLVDAGAELPPTERPKAGTLAALAIQQDRAILLRDAEREREALGLPRSGFGQVNERSIMVAPLRIRGNAIGAVSVQSVNANAYDDGDLELLGAIASEAAVAIERAELYQRTSDLSRRLVALHRIGIEMAVEQDVVSIARTLAESTRELVGSSALAIYLEDGDAFRFMYRAGPSRTEVPRLPKTLPLTARAAQGEVVEVSDSAQAPEESRRMLEASGNRAVLLQPLQAANEVVGIAFATWTEPHSITDEERELVGILAGMGASAIRSARLYSELDEAYLSTVQTLMTTIQARDGYHEDHAMRVAADAVALGERLGLPEPSVRDLRYASLFHSIGKIGVPQEILAKPGALSDEERRIVHEHPVLGARIVEGIRFLRGVVPIVRSANERWDGSGYPDGLAYEAIPYEARILQIVLSYHAMLVDRPYRRALDQRGALAELRLLAGSRYDPGLVDEFAAMLEQRGVADAAERHVQEGAHELAILAEITPAFSTLLDLKQLLDRVLGTLERHMPGTRLVVLLRDEHTQDLVVRAVAGEGGEAPPGFRLARGRGLAGVVLQRREPVLVDDVRNDIRYVERDPETRAVLMVPLVSEDRAIGVLSVMSRRIGAFSQRDQTLLQAVAAQIAAAIEVAELHERLKRAANTDALTGLHNYRYFYDRLEEEIARAERRGTPLSIAYFDIDRLKRVNDEHGHLAGDTVLRTLGSAVDSHVRQEDVPARYGGDEFAIVMPETPREAAEGAVHRLMGLLDSSRIELPDGREIPMPRRSWGVATFPVDGLTAKDLVEVADSRAYERKRAKA